MVDDIDAARRRAANQGDGSGVKPAVDPVEQAAREKTERLRDLRLAKEALSRKGAQIRSDRRRGR